MNNMQREKFELAARRMGYSIQGFNGQIYMHPLTNCFADGWQSRELEVAELNIQLTALEGVALALRDDMRMARATHTPAGDPVGEVVAWDHPNEERKISFQWLRFDVEPGTKLYAAPPAPAVPDAMLTDEQIDAIIDSRGNIAYVIADKRERLHLFAREILRAAMLAKQPISADVILDSIANHIASSKSGLPQEWQDWAEEIESDLRKLAAAPSPSAEGHDND